jgi:hypothetical protein
MAKSDSLVLDTVKKPFYRCGSCPFCWVYCPTRLSSIKRYSRNCDFKERKKLFYFKMYFFKEEEEEKEGSHHTGGKSGGTLYCPFPLSPQTRIDPSSKRTTV